jgi:small subunit ribosomal protein S16
MPAKIRLQRHGRKKRPFYHIVVADARAPRDGKFIEKIGTYNPMTSPATIDLDRDKAFDWLMKGAQPTYTMAAILRFKGVMFRKHLQRGVAKGAISQEQADAKYNQFIEDKDAKIAARFEKSAQEKIDRLKAIDGVPGKSKAVAVEAVAEGDAFKTEGPDTRSLADQVEQTTIDSVVADAPAEVKEEAPAVVAEAPAPEVKEEAPAPEVKEEAPAPEVKEETPAPVAEAPAAGPDEYKKIEGIGPKIEELLHNAGLATFADLADAPVDKLKEILAEAGSRYSMHDPTTWPQQSKLAADGKWDELKTLQDELDGGKPPVA